MPAALRSLTSFSQTPRGVGEVVSTRSPVPREDRPGAWPTQERRRMKAEHRKELQTNTLADNLGRMIQGGRNLSRRTVLIAVVVVGLLLGYWMWRAIQNNNAL